MWKLLKDSRKYLTKQQYRTIKGQMIAGDIEGAMKGLNRLLKNKRGEQNGEKTKRQKN